MREFMHPASLRQIVDRHALVESGHGGPLWDRVIHADRGALLDLCRRLVAVIDNLAAAAGTETCPLCGDPECSAPLLDVLRERLAEEQAQG